MQRTTSYEHTHRDLIDRQAAANDRPLLDKDAQAFTIARTILDGFENHFSLFQEITSGARERFENADWHAAREAARKRIHFYDKRINETIEILREDLNIEDLDKPLWEQIKVEYMHLLFNHQQPELAESYYNSVFCKLFDRRYYNNTKIFVQSSISTEHLGSDYPTYRTYYPAELGLRRTMTKILSDLPLTLPFENKERDVRNMMYYLSTILPRDKRTVALNYQIDILSSLFFRNKATYLIGRAINDYTMTPFFVPILNNERGSVYVDALLTDPADLDAVFGFSRAYFMVETQVPSE